MTKTQRRKVMGVHLVGFPSGDRTFWVQYSAPVQVGSAVLQALNHSGIPADLPFEVYRNGGKLSSRQLGAAYRHNSAVTVRPYEISREDSTAAS